MIFLLAVQEAWDRRFYPIRLVWCCPQFWLDIAPSREPYPTRGFSAVKVLLTVLNLLTEFSFDNLQAFFQILGPSVSIRTPFVDGYSA